MASLGLRKPLGETAYGFQASLPNRFGYYHAHSKI
jgi:hypothetical protein